MTSTFTANKHLEEPAHGDYVNDWNVPVNANFTAIDTALGGNVTINVTGVSGTVALTTAQYQPFYIILTGTLTANIVYQFPSGVGGQWTVKNGTTGAFTVTFGSAGGGSSYVVPQGTDSNILSDGTNVQAVGISSFSGGSTGLTPATASNGAITLGGTLAVASGGTGTTTSTGTGSVVLSTGPSIASPGLTGTPTAPTAATGTNTTQIATTAFVQDGLNHTLGYNQTYNDVTASRAIGTTYTNSTGKPIFVCVSPNSSGYYWYFYVNGIAINQGNQSTGNNATVTVIVPPGSTYQITGSIDILKWIELS